MVRLDAGDRLDINPGGKHDGRRGAGAGRPERRENRRDGRKNGEKSVSGASFTTPRLHVHRDREQAPERKEVRLAREIALLFLDALGAPYREQEAGGCAWRALLGRPGSLQEAEIALPGSPGETTAVPPGGRSWGCDPAARAAPVEIALAWLEAGLIDRLCDFSRWKRALDTSREREAAAAEALAGLGIPVNAGPRPWPDRPHSPDPEASGLARRLHLSLDPQGAAVLLFGSRGRGDHTMYSDTDLMVCVPGEIGPEARARAETGAHRFTRSGEPGPPGGPGNVDLSFPRQWREPLWGHHMEKLLPEPPSGVAFARDLRALSSLPISLRDPGADPTRGAPFHFLAPGCAAEAYRDHRRGAREPPPGPGRSPDGRGRPDADQGGIRRPGHAPLPGQGPGTGLNLRGEGPQEAPGSPESGFPGRGRPC